MYLAGHGRESGSSPEPGINEANANANDAGELSRGGSIGNAILSKDALEQ